MNESLNKLLNEGTLLIKQKDSPYSNEDWRLLNQLTDLEVFPFEYVAIGDTGEPEKLQVGRIVTDVTESILIENNNSKKIWEIINSNKSVTFLKNLLSLKDIVIRRCQVHILRTDCFIGYHLDKDSNPDYLYAVILQFSESYSGGDFIVHNTNSEKKFVYRSFYGELLVTRCDFPHEVTKVKNGERKSLVFFVSENRGLNKRFIK